MRRALHSPGNLPAWILALALSAGLLFGAGPVRADGDPLIEAPVPAYPRWSNDHHMQGIYATPDCQVLPPGMAADYVRNTDAWGRPVIPADQPPDLGAGLPLAVIGEVPLGQKQIGGKLHDFTGLYLPPVPHAGTSGAPGFPLPRDCAPPAK